MAEERAKRKLSAILSADVKGYSRLMGEDELGTIETLKNYREIMGALIDKFKGRVVDSPGDNVLAEFSSVVDALDCAVEIQEKLKQKNEELPENRRMEFRIGVNLGDVVEDGERIYGDGVNIAARVESLAEGGGICISGTAFDQIGKKLAVGYEYLGEQTVKNIEKPVRVYRVLTEPEAAGEVIGEKRPGLGRGQRVALGFVAALVVVAAAVAVWHFHFRPPPIEAASVEKMAFPLPDRPSIAVLPFDNLTGDPQQEYFSDGMTEEIITALSKVPHLFVIARNSTFSYKGKPVKIHQVAEELGVRYVLEGSVRRAGDRVRVTAQLIDAIKGHHLWAERYERELKDTFALQDEITRKILRALKVRLTEGEQATPRGKGTKNLEAFLKVLQAGWYLHHMSKERRLLARQLAEEAMALDPEYAGPYMILAHCHIQDVFFGWSKSRKKSLEQALELAQKAISLDESDPDHYVLLSGIYMFKKQYQRAIAEAERAIALDPNGADALSQLSTVLAMAGRQQEAIAPSEKAIRINPIAPPIYFRRLALAYRDTGRYEEAIAAYKKTIKLAPDSLFAHIGLAVTYSLAGRDEEARAEAAEALRIQPKLSLESLAKRVAYKNKADIDRMIDALRKAGLPHKPPLPLPDKPSIAVLPFTNMSEDPKQEYFTDGMTEDLITDLSKISGLFVIARNSAFTYKGKAVKVEQISRELGVRYVLEGSVRKADDRVRINAQLIDATTGGHLWAERYDGELGDVFALQDKVTQKIVAALAVKLTAGEQEQIARKYTDNVAAYDAFLQGREHYWRFTPDDFAQAARYFEKAVELDPNYGRAYAMLALTYWVSAGQGWSKSLGVSPVEAWYQTEIYLQKAMNNPTSIAHQVASYLHTHLRGHEEAIAEAQRAIALDPNDANSYLTMALALIPAGRPKEALDFVAKAMRLDPHYPAIYLNVLGRAQFSMEQFDEAANSFERALKRNPENYWVLLYLAAAYGHLGRKQEATAAIEEWKKIYPVVGELSVERISDWPPAKRYKNSADKKRFLEGLRKAGVPTILDILLKPGKK